MILVDIYVPSTNRQYDFKLEENAYIADILEEIGEMMFASQESKKEEIDRLLLCDYEKQRILPLNQTLKQNNISSGSRLVLL